MIWERRDTSWQKCYYARWDVLEFRIKDGNLGMVELDYRQGDDMWSDIGHFGNITDAMNAAEHWARKPNLDVHGPE